MRQIPSVCVPSDAIPGTGHVQHCLKHAAGTRPVIYVASASKAARDMYACLHSPVNSQRCIRCVQCMRAAPVSAFGVYKQIEMEADSRARPIEPGS